MRSTLTPEEIASYRDLGFVVLEDFLDAGELEEWRSAVGEAVDAYRAAQEGDAGPDEFYTTIYRQKIDTTVLNQLINLWRVSPRVRKLILDERIGRLGCELEGIDGIRLLTDQALIKPPYGAPTAFHLDNPYASFTSDHHLNLWVALDDATVLNGCLFYLPGSHKWRKTEKAEIGPSLGAIIDTYPEWRELEPTPCPVAAGGAIFHNGLVAHGAAANMTPRPRRAMTATFMPADATFNGNQNVLSDQQVAQLSVGDPLDDEQQNPLVFAR